MHYLIVYDISNDKTRLKVARFLQKYGYRVQLSAFYLPDIDNETLDYIYTKIYELINKTTDRVFFYPVHPPEIFKGYPLEPWECFVF